MSLWSSGLRRGTQVAVWKQAWVQIPSVTLIFLISFVFLRIIQSDDLIIVRFIVIVLKQFVFVFVFIAIRKDLKTLCVV